MLKAMLTLLMLLQISSCSGGGVSTEPIVTPSKFGEKIKNLHQTIVITKPGVYDYEGTMHVWKGGGFCNVVGASYPVMEIRSNNVTVKNFGFKDAKTGIRVLDTKDGSARENVTIKNVEGYACYSSIEIPGRSKNLRVEESIFMVE